MILFTLNEINKVQQPVYIPTHGPRAQAWGFEKLKVEKVQRALK